MAFLCDKILVNTRAVFVFCLVFEHYIFTAVESVAVVVAAATATMFVVADFVAAACAIPVAPAIVGGAFATAMLVIVAASGC